MQNDSFSNDFSVKWLFSYYSFNVFVCFDSSRPSQQFSVMSLMPFKVISFYHRGYSQKKKNMLPIFFPLIVAPLRSGFLDVETYSTVQKKVYQYFVRFDYLRPNQVFSHVGTGLQALNQY